MAPKKSTPAKNKPVINGDALDDAFVVMLRYAEFSGEKLSAKHSATAVNVGQSTAFARIAKAKSETKLSNTASCSSGYGLDAFKVLLRYADACGEKLKVPAAAKAAGIGQSTAFSKVAAAKRETEAAAAEDGADVSGAHEEEKEETGIKKFPKKREANKIAAKTISGSKRKRSASEEDDDTLDPVAVKKEKVDEGVAMSDMPEDAEGLEEEKTVSNGSTVAPCTPNDDDGNQNVIRQEDAGREHVDVAGAVEKTSIDLEHHVGVAQTDMNIKVVKHERVHAEAEDEHRGAPMDLETSGDNLTS